MEFELFGGKLRYWILPFCLMYKSITNTQRHETYHTISFELLRWYIALSIITHHGTDRQA